MLLANYIYSSALQTLDLFSVSSLQWREYGYVARLKLVRGMGRDTTEYYVVLKAKF